MNRRTWLIAGLLAGSGFCALVYQVVWLRELRLVFGASTPASAAVVAIFMAGLGAGGWVLGRRADCSAAPLRFYAKLEFGIAALAALTPLLIEVATRAYLASGGAPANGALTATLLRLGLATLVLSGPTFLMGGTLPAAARAASTDTDPGRRAVAALYGLNTLGGVAGALVPTFFLFERAGVRGTLWLACALNLVVAALAWRAGRLTAPATAQPLKSPVAVDADRAPAAPAMLVLTAAGLSGCAFLAMELVWYRMLTPLLGGSTYTFGLILAVVLLGIGAGGLGYALFGQRRQPDLTAFAVTCVLEAVLLALPLALGDRLAAWALLMQPPDAAGFAARVRVWSLLCAVIVLPGTLVAGWQFPLLIGLLGRGRNAVGRHVGQAYAWNTVGAIVGSLAGGFVLMQALTAPGLWRAVVVVLLLLGAVAALLAWRGPRGPRGPRLRLRSGIVLALVAVGVVLVTAAGPGAAWRHAPIGAGRMRLDDTSRNGLRAYQNEIRRNTRWEAEGIESSVALQSTLGLSFIINGKSDGSARFDAPTQVMCGLVAAALHPAPRSALVIGLGSGSTAGWLAAVPTITRVDVAELEPAIVEVARACDAVNARPLDNPKVKLFLGDGREMLLTARDRYDIIASEPSNPYRAGIASLFTRECYRAVRAHLNPGGCFVQWVQAYEIDEQTLRTIVATRDVVDPARERLRWSWTSYVGRKDYSLREPSEWAVAILQRGAGIEHATEFARLARLSEIASELGDNRERTSIANILAGAIDAAVEAPPAFESAGAWRAEVEVLEADMRARRSGDSERIRERLLRCCQLAVAGRSHLDASDVDRAIGLFAARTAREYGWTFDWATTAVRTLSSVLSDAQAWTLLRQHVARLDKEKRELWVHAVAWDFDALCWMRAVTPREILAGLDRVLATHEAWLTGCGHFPTPLAG